MSRVSPNQGTQHVGSNLHSSGLVEFCFKPEPRTQVENQNVLKYRLEEMSLGLQHREVGFQESHTQPCRLWVDLCQAGTDNFVRSSHHRICKGHAGTSSPKQSEVFLTFSRDKHLL